MPALAVAVGLLLSTAAALSGCGGRAHEAPDVAIECSVVPPRPKVGPAGVVCTIKLPDGAPVAGAAVRVEGNMSHPGMEPVFVDATEVSPGRYEAPMRFTMPGDWVVSITAKLPDGRSFERRLDVPGVESG